MLILALDTATDRGSLALVEGETLLVAGASSGVGVAAVQIGKALGATVIGTSGSEAKLAKLKTVGMDHGIHTRKPDFATKCKELTGGKGGDNQPGELHCLECNSG